MNLAKEIRTFIKNNYEEFGYETIDAVFIKFGEDERLKDLPDKISYLNDIYISETNKLDQKEENKNNKK